MKRQRGRGRKPGGGGNHGNRPLESNGPDVKIRGTAAQIYEKYIQYSRDAQSAGDRVKHENYLQHAEHYFRIMAATMPRDRVQQIQDGAPQGQPEDRADQDAQPQANGQEVSDEEDDVETSDEGDADEAEAEVAQQADRAEAGERGEGGGRNRRRRGRRRPSDERHGDGGERSERPERLERNGADTEARSALDALARKQGALS